ncbi:hypothetical protein FQN60_010003 [Etheostoma spectabile]|uniref:Uncharacterized protein n=1 Tax=Etheostoma spectabile TaxID=54343 RepID=A0A5J5D1M6_9PERO|nr:hypothetical protein FQN60_010003 [Etheostoma spectabile]
MIPAIASHPPPASLEEYGMEALCKRDVMWFHAGGLEQSGLVSSPQRKTSIFITDT